MKLQNNFIRIFNQNLNNVNQNQNFMKTNVHNLNISKQ